jgi:hypothetical protein
MVRVVVRRRCVVFVFGSPPAAVPAAFSGYSSGPFRLEVAAALRTLSSELLDPRSMPSDESGGAFVGVRDIGLSFLLLGETVPG